MDSADQPECQVCGAPVPEGSGLCGATACRDAVRSVTAVAALAAANAWAEANHPLPRCRHGSALQDAAGERLEPPCGCRSQMPSRLLVWQDASSVVGVWVGRDGIQGEVIAVLVNTYGPEGRWAVTFRAQAVATSVADTLEEAKNACRQLLYQELKKADPRGLPQFVVDIDQRILGIHWNGEEITPEAVRHLIKQSGVMEAVRQPLVEALPTEASLRMAATIENEIESGVIIRDQDTRKWKLSGHIDIVDEYEGNTDHDSNS